ncbi:MAG: hypothetical protein HYV07_15300 [Deltaproteobacteria bacterium]|nr:hypothetical protein [Deltaproteobacteria bacterium]
MKKPRSSGFGRRALDELTIEDDASFAHIALYSDLKEVLRRAGYAFRTLPDRSSASWDRALFLNMVYWAAEDGGDILVDEVIPADVVTHVAWHHLAARALHAVGRRPPVEAMFLAESIASAFDVYLVGRVLGHAPESTFLETQVTAMAETAKGAGLDALGFAALLRRLSDQPERCFASVRELLSDATARLFAAEGAEGALAVLTTLERHPFSPLLHRYELASWILSARARASPEPSAEARAVDRALRKSSDPLEWLAETWVRPALRD